MDNVRRALIELYDIVERNVTAKFDAVRKGALTSSLLRRSLNEEEMKTLKAVSTDTVWLSAMENLTFDLVLECFYEFFALLDGVTDPEIVPGELWLGLTLCEPGDDGNTAMLHDLL
ncbi:MAG: hypothetical protein IRZ10_05075 [Thermoflavifilum sp.]|nr:hypothetical protein [Thermoflavifilum sp.]MCL6513772.1 hypothetical protein [Alicyclobacillus sp.]